jgi:hypothetical protein
VNDGTLSAALFRDTALDLQRRLSKVRDPRARALEADAARLGALFGAWATKRPESGERVQAIKSLMDLQRTAMALLSSA